MMARNAKNQIGKSTMAIMTLQTETQNLVDILKALPQTLKPRLEAYTDGACSGNPGPG